jgi:hypothetical protein
MLVGSSSPMYPDHLRGFQSVQSLTAGTSVSDACEVPSCEVPSFPPALYGVILPWSRHRDVPKSRDFTAAFVLTAGKTSDICSI